MALNAGLSGVFKPGVEHDKRGMHYIGIVLVLSWYYCLWFVPDIIHNISLYEFSNTISWLSSLFFSGLFLLVLPLFAKQRPKPLQNPTTTNYVVSVALTALTLMFTLCTPIWTAPVLYVFVFPAVLGLLNAILWLLWGEYHGQRHSKFTIDKVAPVFAVILGISVIVAHVLPTPLDSIFVSCIPLASMAAFKIERSALPEKVTLPPLLPEKPRKKATTSMIVICLTISACCAACYYNIAIIPVEYLPEDGIGYLWGVFASAILVLLFGLTYKYLLKKASIYQSIPWLMVVCVVSISLYASGYTELYLASFEISVALCGIFEVLIIMYFGSLSSRGYLSPAVAFGLSSGCVRIGFLLGNSVAVVEEVLGVVDTFGQPMALVSICLLAIIIIPHIRQEQSITGLTVNNSSTYEIDDICDSVIKEFGLSAREGEIIRLIAKGYTVDSISKKLYISPYTTQTHVRHIYAKMQIHKRSELLDYINMHRSE